MDGPRRRLIHGDMVTCGRLRAPRPRRVIHRHPEPRKTHPGRPDGARSARWHNCSGDSDSVSEWPLGRPADRRGARRGGPAGQRRGRAARRRRDRAVHRPVPQGGHRHPGRRAAAHPRGAAALPARARRAPGGDPQGDHRPGQADRRARSADPGRGLQGPPGGPVPAVQAQAADQGPDRPRGGPGAAGRPAPGRPDARPAARQHKASSTKPSPTRTPRWKAPAPSWSSGSPRTPT